MANKRPAGAVSGKLVVILLFSTALLLWGIVFLTGYRQKLANREGRDAARWSRDTVVTPDSVRAWMRRLPPEWLKVTPVEGQGFVIFVPCYSSNSRLTLKTPLDSLPSLVCEYCDSLDAYAVPSMSRSAADSQLEFHLQPGAGRVEVLPVGDSLLAKFPEAPFRDRLLLWIRDLAPDSTGRAKADTMFFVPKSEESEFEVLRAEDENPEGCGGESGD